MKTINMYLIGEMHVAENMWLGGTRSSLRVHRLSYGPPYPCSTSDSITSYQNRWQRTKAVESYTYSDDV